MVVEHQLGRIGARLQLRLRFLAIALPVVVAEHEGPVEGADDGAAVDPEEGVQVGVAGDQATQGQQVSVG